MYKGRDMMRIFLDLSIQNENPRLLWVRRPDENFQILPQYVRITSGIFEKFQALQAILVSGAKGVSIIFGG